MSSWFEDEEVIQAGVSSARRAGLSFLALGLSGVALSLFVWWRDSSFGPVAGWAAMGVVLSINLGETLRKISRALDAVRCELERSHR